MDYTLNSDALNENLVRRLLSGGEHYELGFKVETQSHPNDPLTCGFLEIEDARLDGFDDPVLEPDVSVTLEYQRACSYGGFRGEPKIQVRWSASSGRSLDASHRFNEMVQFAVSLGEVIQELYDNESHGVPAELDHHEDDSFVDQNDIRRC